MYLQASPPMDPATPRRRVHSVEQQKEVFQVSTRLPSAAVSTGHPAELRSLLIHSAVFAVAIPSLLSYSGGEQVRASWTLSLFVILYLFGCSVAYSAPPTHLAKMFLALSYVGLLAFCVGTVVSTVLGVVFIYVDSFLAAGLFGGVLAQHREGNGREIAAFIAVENAPPGKYQRQLGMYFFIVFFALFFAIVWVMRPEGDYDALDIAMNLFGAIAFLEFLQTMTVLGWLNGAVFGADSSALVAASFATIGILFVVSYLLTGSKVVAAIFLWLCVLAATAFLGYYLRVHATYEEMMITYEELMIMRNTIPALATYGSAAAAPTTENSPATRTSPGTKEKTTDGSTSAAHNTRATPPGTEETTTDPSAAVVSAVTKETITEVAP